MVGTVEGRKGKGKGKRLVLAHGQVIDAVGKE
jgi:hypothetical protein